MRKNEKVGGLDLSIDWQPTEEARARELASALYTVAIEAKREARVVGPLAAPFMRGIGFGAVLCARVCRSYLLREERRWKFDAVEELAARKTVLELEIENADH